MAQKKQQKTRKKELPSPAQYGSQRNHMAYEARDKHPERVLRNIVRSNGPEAARAYAEKYGLNNVLVAHPSILLAGWKALYQPQPRLVGRALRRHMKRLSLLAQAKKKALAQQPAPPSAPVQQPPTQQ